MNKKVRLILLAIILVLGVFLLNQLKYRNNELYAVNLKNKIDKDLVSILVSDGSNNYTNYEGNTFPSNTEYKYNSELSKCQDNNGNVIEGILSYNETTGKVSIRTKKTTYCYLYFDKIPSEPLGDILIASGELWQSGLEGDGYRYTGTGVSCSYDNGNYIQYAAPSCPKLYNYIETRISDGSTTNYTYQTRCPSNDSNYTYSCTELNGTIIPESINAAPNNFICFGTNSLSECKANEDKYMYRIIGVFPDESGEQHLKLIKYKQLGAYMWYENMNYNVDWEESDLYKGLNGISGGYYNNLFIGNTTYDYLQDNTWLNKIVDWKWTATNTLTWSDSGPNYYSITTEQIYLHEMNRSTKTNTKGSWTYPRAKIGLMYESDYSMSLGSSSLTMTSAKDYATLKTGWLHQSNNDLTASRDEWLMSRADNGRGGNSDTFYAWTVYGGTTSGGLVLDLRDEFVRINVNNGVRPVLYLDSNVSAKDGTGSYSSPYLIK